MRKIKVLAAIIIIAILIPLTTMAYDVELDPEGYISMPMMIMNGEGTINISEDVATGYELSYQLIEMSEAEFNQLEEIWQESEDYANTSTEELEVLKTELDALKKDYEDKLAEDPDSPETAEAEEKYSTAVEEYNAKVKEINQKILEYVETAKSKIPSYVENNWISSEENKVKLDLSQFNNTKYFVLWAKLVTEDGTTYYDEQIYSVNGQKEDIDIDDEENKIEEITNTNSSTTNTVGKNDSTVSNSTRLPKAGKSLFITLISITMLVALITGVVSYKKYKFLKKIK